MKWLGIRHPKREGQREMERGADRARESHILCEGRETKKKDLEGPKIPPPPSHSVTDAHTGAADTWGMKTHTHTHTHDYKQKHTLGGRGTEGVTWAWQLLSSFTVSPSPRRSLSTKNQKQFLAHLPSTSCNQSPEDLSRRGGRERPSTGGGGPLPAPSAPSVP